MKWREVEILEVLQPDSSHAPGLKRVKVHFVGFDSRYDEVVSDLPGKLPVRIRPSCGTIDREFENEAAKHAVASKKQKSPNKAKNAPSAEENAIQLFQRKILKESENTDLAIPQNYHILIRYMVEVKDKLEKLREIYTELYRNGELYGSNPHEKGYWYEQFAMQYNLPEPYLIDPVLAQNFASPDDIAAGLNADGSSNGQVSAAIFYRIVFEALERSYLFWEHEGMRRKLDLRSSQNSSEYAGSQHGRMSLISGGSRGSHRYGRRQHMSNRFGRHGKRGGGQKFRKRVPMLESVQEDVCSWFPCVASTLNSASDLLFCQAFNDYVFQNSAGYETGMNPAASGGANGENHRSGSGTPKALTNGTTLNITGEVIPVSKKKKRSNRSTGSRSRSNSENPTPMSNGSKKSSRKNSGSVKTEETQKITDSLKTTTTTHSDETVAVPTVPKIMMPGASPELQRTASIASVASSVKQTTLVKQIASDNRKEHPILNDGLVQNDGREVPAFQRQNSVVISETNSSSMIIPSTISDDMLNLDSTDKAAHNRRISDSNISSSVPQGSPGSQTTPGSHQGASDVVALQQAVRSALGGEHAQEPSSVGTTDGLNSQMINSHNAQLTSTQSKVGALVCDPQLAEEIAIGELTDIGSFAPKVWKFVIPRGGHAIWDDDKEMLGVGEESDVENEVENEDDDVKFDNERKNSNFSISDAEQKPVVEAVPRRKNRMTVAISSLEDPIRDNGDEEVIFDKPSLQKNKTISKTTSNETTSTIEPGMQTPIKTTKTKSQKARGSSGGNAAIETGGKGLKKNFEDELKDVRSSRQSTSRHASGRSSKHGSHGRESSHKEGGTSHNRRSHRTSKMPSENRSSKNYHREHRDGTQRKSSSQNREARKVSRSRSPEIVPGRLKPTKSEWSTQLDKLVGMFY